MTDCYFINIKDDKIPTQNWSLQTGTQPARGWNVSGLSQWLPNGLMNLPVSRCWLNFQNFVQIDKCTEMILVCSFVWVCSSAQASLEMRHLSSEMLKRGRPCSHSCQTWRQTWLCCQTAEAVHTTVRAHVRGPVADAAPVHKGSLPSLCALRWPGLNTRQKPDQMIVTLKEFKWALF